MRKKILNSFDVDQIAEKVFRGEDDPYSAVEKVLTQIKITVRVRGRKTKNYPPQLTDGTFPKNYKKNT